jgi:hypothetical protein
MHALEELLTCIITAGAELDFKGKLKVGNKDENTHY